MFFELTGGPFTVKGSTSAEFVVHTVTFTVVSFTVVTVFVTFVDEPLTADEAVTVDAVVFKGEATVTEPLADNTIFGVVTFAGIRVPFADITKSVVTGPVLLDVAVTVELIEELLRATAGNTDSTGAAGTGDTVLFTVVVVVVHTVLFT